MLWTRMATGYLASVLVLLHEFARAEALLATTLSPDTPAQTMAQRVAWCAYVELALAQGQPARALGIINQLMAFDAQRSEGQGSVRLLKLRGEALAALQQPAEAEAALTAAQAIATAQGVRPLQWRISILLGNLYRTQGRKVAAEQAFADARTLIEALTGNISDQRLRESYLGQTLTLLPATSASSPARTAKQAFGGLTERERAVARLIALGKSNQEIADTLVVAKRTIETHVSNIMFKLGSTSRTQIAVWAVETGLAEPQ